MSIASFSGVGQTHIVINIFTVKLLIFSALPFFLLSCANLAEDRWDEKEVATTPTTDPEQPVEVPEPPTEEVDDGLKLADPVTTSELMKDEDKKTVNGPATVNLPTSDADSAIDIQPTIPTAPAEE